jgi:polysaccharide export outer membrane protein
MTFKSVMLIALLSLATGRLLTPACADSPGTRPIMAGDRLRITVVEAPEMNRVYPVAGDGSLDLGLLGRVVVDGLTPGEAAQDIESKLESRYFKRATVSIEVAEFVEGSLLVLGGVVSPGEVPFKGDEIVTLMEVIGRSGGLAPMADGKNVKILRWKRGGGLEREVISVDVKAMLDNLDFTKDQFLRPRDIILVPSLGAGEGSGEFLALGQFGSPGFHPHSEGMDVIRAVAKAGGLSINAKMDAGRLLRLDGSGSYRVMPLDLSRLFGQADMTMNMPILPGDILFVPTAEQSSGGKVYLLGEVNAPGMLTIPLDRETTLARTLLTGGGFTKFANTARVRVQRSGPGGRQVMEVDVGRILKTGNFDDDVPLQNEDVIIVPERLIF